MRLFLFIVAIAVSGLFSSCPQQVADDLQKVEHESSAPPAADRQAVLVELFTSEGCSSCPPADRNLVFLEKQQPVAQAEIITLAFHVDYWDRLGWKDRFSSPLYSRRQQIYTEALNLNSNYTPQMVVDGKSEFVGSDSGKASKEISKSAESAKALIEVTAEENHLKVKIRNAPRHGEATVYAAIAEDGISTRVERGENSGKTLEHISVVRELKTVGVLAEDKNELEVSSDFQVGAEWKPENLKVVVFVQENQARRIIGVGKVKLR
ncbi:MAG: DUF1223 domain-containing protein [Acidobacteriota bacterium]